MEAMKYRSVNKDSGKSLTTLGNLADLSSSSVTHWASWGSVCSEMEKKKRWGTTGDPNSAISGM